MGDQLGDLWMKRGKRMQNAKEVHWWTGLYSKI